MFRIELQHSLRHAAARARPDLSIRRCARLCRPEVVHLPAWHDAGLPGNADAAGIRFRESPGHEIVRLWNVLLRLSAWAQGSRPWQAPRASVLVEWSGRAG